VEVRGVKTGTLYIFWPGGIILDEIIGIPDDPEVNPKTTLFG
jgi:hypothetical protein